MELPDEIMQGDQTLFARELMFGNGDRMDTDAVRRSFETARPVVELGLEGDVRKFALMAYIARLKVEAAGPDVELFLPESGTIFDPKTQEPLGDEEAFIGKQIKPLFPGLKHLGVVEQQADVALFV